MRIAAVLACVAVSAAYGQSTDSAANTASFTTFDVPGAMYTEPYSINSEGDVVGTYSDGVTNHGFLRHANGNLETFAFAGAGPGGTGAYSINDVGAIAGNWYDVNSLQQGFVRVPNATLTAFAVSGAILTSALAINLSGTVTGVYSDSSNLDHGFLRSPDGTIQTFDAPSASQTIPEAIDSLGAIAGWYLDGGGREHAFIRHSDGSFIEFEAPGATQSLGIRSTQRVQLRATATSPAWH